MSRQNIIIGIVVIIILIIIGGLIYVSKKKEGLSYKTPVKPEKFAPYYQVRKEKFSGDFIAPMVAKAQRGVDKNPFVGPIH